MIATKRLFYLGLGGATAALSAGYGLLGAWQWLPLILITSGAWLWGRPRRKWASSVGFFLHVVLAAGGVIGGAASSWMLVAVVGALFAWDLDDWIWRQQSIGLDRVPPILKRQHLSRLLAVTGIGLCLAFIPLLISLRLSFGMVLLMGLLAALGLRQVVAFLRREGA